MTEDTTTKVRSQSSLGVLAVLAATACWSSAGVIAKNADLPGVVIAFWRLVLVSGTFGLIAAVTRKRITLAMLRRSLLGGLLFGVNLAVWFEALRHASVGIATVTSALTPVMTLVIGARVLGEAITAKALWCACGAVGGIAVFVAFGFANGATTAFGFAMALAAIFIWVCYLFVSKRARQGVGTIEYMLCMAVIAALSLVPFMVLFTDEGLTPPSHGWGWLIALALIPGCLGHGLLAWAQAHVPLSTAGILLQGEPVGAAFAGVIFLGESMVALQVLGLAVTVGALVVLSLSTSPGAAEQDAAST